MNDWSLTSAFSRAQDEIQQELERARKSSPHSPTSGAVSEDIWLQFLERYLPERYRCTTAHVADSNDTVSQQIDIVIFDRQYTPFIVDYYSSRIVPAESVYAVFEVKQQFSKAEIDYAGEKIASVRRLHRTSIPIPHAGGEYAAKPPIKIIGGLLALDNSWQGELGTALQSALKDQILKNGRLDLGCCANSGGFKYLPDENEFSIVNCEHPAMWFLFQLISELQRAGTVPAIDIQAYAKLLDSEADHV